MRQVPLVVAGDAEPLDAAVSWRVQNAPALARNSVPFDAWRPSLGFITALPAALAANIAEDRPPTFVRTCLRSTFHLPAIIFDRPRVLRQTLAQRHDHRDEPAGEDPRGERGNDDDRRMQDRSISRFSSS